MSQLSQLGELLRAARDDICSARAARDSKFSDLAVKRKSLSLSSSEMMFENVASTSSCSSTAARDLVISRLESKVKEQQGELVRLRAALDDAQNHLHINRGKLTHLSTKAEGDRVACESYRLEVLDLKTKLATKESEYELLLSRYQTETTNSATSSNEYARKSKQLEKDLALAQNKITLYEKSNDKLKALLKFREEELKQSEINLKLKTQLVEELEQRLIASEKFRERANMRLQQEVSARHQQEELAFKSTKDNANSNSDLDLISSSSSPPHPSHFHYQHQQLHTARKSWLPSEPSVKDIQNVTSSLAELEQILSRPLVPSSKQKNSKT